MRNYIRLKTPGACYFFTIVTHNRRHILCLPEARTALRSAIRSAINQTRQTMPFEIIAWVLMPDHLHCIWTLPKGDSDNSKRWSMIKRLVSKTCRHLAAPPPKTKQQSIAFWQKRFWEHQMRDDKDLENLLNYIHYNPVKHGLCQMASQWQFSTLHRYIKQGKYSKDWGEGVNIPEEAGNE